MVKQSEKHKPNKERKENKIGMRKFHQATTYTATVPYPSWSTAALTATTMVGIPYPIA